jgi:phthalate 4,5-cis-dihydrodiol dehydrogenase
MIRAARTDPHIVLAAGADPQTAPRDRFAWAFSAKAFADFEAMCREPELDAIYIASPHRFHADQATYALGCGKHVVVEKPMALDVADCDRMIRASEVSGKGIIVGHTHAFDPNVRAIADLARGGTLGPLGMIACLNYNDFLFRPHRSDEFDPTFGGGILFNQIAHQVEVARLIADSPVLRVQAHLGALSTHRPAPGHGTAMIFFAGGCVASLVFSAYDGFDSDEWHYKIAEGGTSKQHVNGATRLAFESRSGSETEAHFGLAYGARDLPNEQPFLPHFGVLIATFQIGDVRLAPNGLTVYRADGIEDLPIERGSSRPGHGDVLADLYRLVRTNVPSRFDAAWGRDTIAVLTALKTSATEGREVSLSANAAGSPNIQERGS